MKHVYIIVGVVVLVVVSGIFFVRQLNAPTVDDTIHPEMKAPEIGGSEVNGDEEEPQPAPLKLESEIPLTIERGIPVFEFSGETPGTMFFEGSFYIEVFDETDSLVYDGLATAVDEWMTEEYVPFTASLVRKSDPESDYGTMVFHRDNPSGLAEHDLSFEIPVEFITG